MRQNPGISIHALLAESDYLVRGQRPNWGISIHALLAESDAPWPARLASRAYFYPRSPCGERLNPSYAALDGASIYIHALLAESDLASRLADMSAA